MPDVRPLLVLVTGEPGSGKTSLGIEVARALRLPFLSRDDVRGGLLATAGLWTNELESSGDREGAVEAFVQIVETAARLGVSAVLEFVVFRERAQALARLEAVADCVVIQTVCADASMRADERDRSDSFLNRRAVLGALGHDSIEDYIRAPQRQVVRDGMQTDFDLPTLTVRTDDGYDRPLTQIVDWVIERSRRGDVRSLGD